MLTFKDKGKTYQTDGRNTFWLPGEPFKAPKKRLQYLKYTNPVAFRELAEQVTIELVKYLCSENGGQAVELSKVLREGSYIIGVSPETVKRYVFTHTAMGAELVAQGKNVKPNAHYKPTEDAEEEDDE